MSVWWGVSFLFFSAISEPRHRTAERRSIFEVGGWWEKIPSSEKASLKEARKGFPKKRVEASFLELNTV